MTRQRWEYLVVEYWYTATKSDHRGVPKWEFHKKWWLLSAAENHVEQDATQVTWPKLLASLGKDGWELVSNTVLSSIVKSTLGWDGGTSEPIRIQATFKRSAEA